MSPSSEGDDNVTLSSRFLRLRQLGVVQGSKKTRKRKQESPNTLNLAFSNYITYELIKERRSMKNPDYAYQCFTKFAKSVADKWKSMSTSEKVIFQRVIYEGEVEEEEHGAGGKGRKTVKKAKKAKDPNAPKRTLAAFVRFQVEQRSIMKTDPTQKHLTFTELAKVLSEKWKRMSPHEKEPYETAAKIDSEKYKKDVAAYKKGQTVKLDTPHENEPYETAVKLDLEENKEDVAEYKKGHTSQA